MADCSPALTTFHPVAMYFMSNHIELAKGSHMLCQPFQRWETPFYVARRMQMWPKTNSTISTLETGMNWSHWLWGISPAKTAFHFTLIYPYSMGCGSSLPRKPTLSFVLSHNWHFQKLHSGPSLKMCNNDLKMNETWPLPSRGHRLECCCCLVTKLCLTLFFFLIFLLLLLLFFYFTILYWFCHTSTCIRLGCTSVPHPEPLSQLPPHTILLGHPSAPAPSFLYPASNLDVWLFAILWTVTRQAPLSMGFSRQGYWSGLPFPSQDYFKWKFLIFV